MAIKDQIKRMEMIWAILELIKEKPRTIVEITNKLKMKRSTLKYYLGGLEKHDPAIIETERIEEKLSGRPTMIKLTKYAEEKTIQELVFEPEAEVIRKENEKNPLTYEILEALQRKKEIQDYKMLFSIFSGKDDLEDIKKGIELKRLTDSLKRKGYIECVYRITKDGKQFFKKLKPSQKKKTQS